MSEEEPDIPLHYSLPSLCSGLRLECVPIRQFKGVLKALGYRASHFHREPNAVKTDAPNGVVYDVLRKWGRERRALQAEKRAREEPAGAAAADEPAAKKAKKEKRKHQGAQLRPDKGW